jgi:GDP-mannose pyrophosphatase NudK
VWVGVCVDGLAVSAAAAGQHRQLRFMRPSRWQRQSRETYDRGNGAAILLYDRSRGTVVLTRQFRFPAFVNGSPDGRLIEACAGLLDQNDQDDAVSCIKREVEEETGFAIGEVRLLFQAYMSPGSVTERLYFFAGEYTPNHKRFEGGGDALEGEDIEVLEIPFARALSMLETGEICDGKTIMLLQYAKLHALLGE